MSGILWWIDPPGELATVRAIHKAKCPLVKAGKAVPVDSRKREVTVDAAQRRGGRPGERPDASDADMPGELRERFHRREQRRHGNPLPGAPRRVDRPDSATAGAAAPPRHAEARLDALNGGRA